MLKKALISALGVVVASVMMIPSALAAPSPHTTPTANATPTSAPLDVSATRVEMVDLLNKEREGQGLTSLQENSSLNDIAQGWTQAQVNGGGLSHNSQLYLQAPPGWKSLGENVGYGSGTSDVFRAWIQSSKHKSVIHGSTYTDVGTGVVKDASGKLWVTQIFAQYEVPASANPTPTATVTVTATATATATPSSTPTVTVTRSVTVPQVVVKTPQPVSTAAVPVAKQDASTPTSQTISASPIANKTSGVTSFDILVLGLVSLLGIALAFAAGWVISRRSSSTTLTK